MSKNEEKMHLPKVTVDDFFTTQEERNDEKLEKSKSLYKENKKSVEFYINRGFKIIEEQINDDSKHVEYIMEKSLSRI